MRRPSFQFYPGDWTSNSNLRRCSHAEKGIWIDVMCLLHDQEEYGVVRWPLKEIAQAVNCTIAALRGLVVKGILKGADGGHQVDQFVYVPRSGRKDGDPVTLVHVQPGPLWYSSRMVKDEYVRTIRGESSRFGAEDGDTPKKTPKASPKDAPKDAPKPPLGDGSSASSSASASPTTSVPNGTGDESPAGLSAKEAIYSVGLSWMLEKGCAEKPARSLLGAGIKTLGDDKAWELVRAMFKENPMEPAAWFSGALNVRTKKRGGDTPDARFEN